MRVIERARARWGVGLWGAIAILAAFSLAGLTVVRLRKLILSHLLPADAPTWLWWVSYILLIIPLYQISLLFYGMILGQFRFFWEREKRLGRWLLRKWISRRRSNESGESTRI